MTSLPSQPERRPQVRRAWIKRSTVPLPLLCLIIFCAVIGTSLVSNTANASAASLVSLPGHVPALVKTSGLVGPADANQSLTLAVGLQLRNASSLKNFVDSSSRLKSATKLHLTASEIAANYAPLASSQQSVIDYLQSYGFKITKTLSQHLVITVQGTVGDAESAFHLQMNDYRSAQGQDFYAPASDPSVPTDLASLIQSIAGLDNVRHFSHPPITSTKSVDYSTSAVTGNAVTCLGPGSGYYLPSQFATGYNLNGLYNAGYHGEGQKIGLVEFDDYAASDISAYTNCYGGSSVPINKILVDGGAGSPAAGAIEVELDMENILSAAPKLAALNVYEAPNTDAGAIDMWSQIINSNAVQVVSTSWGSCEPNTTSSVLTQENSLFTLAAAQGQTIVAAAGDYGTNDCRTPLGSTNPVPAQAVDDPASQPYITGVGGTTLTLNSNNTYNSEVVWNNGVVSSVNDVLAGGGGLSTQWSQPSWQSGPGVTNTYSNGKREVPDVSLNADPNVSYIIYCSVAATGCSSAGFYGIGGTSAAAPMWAAFIALTNQELQLDGGSTIGFINPFLYQIDQGVNGTSYANDFHDITVGNNDGLNDGTGIYPATSRYDLATGLGSFNAWNLAQDLIHLKNPQPVQSDIYQLRTDGTIWRYTGTPFTGWQKLDNNPRTIKLAADVNGNLYQLHNDGAIWKYTGTPMTGWQELDNNPQATAIVAAGNGNLFQLHTDGTIWKYTGTPFTGWQKLDNNPKTIALAADASGNLYQLHNDGAIWKYTGTPMTGWQELDNNPQATAIVADGNGDLFQLHKDGTIWKYTGPPMTGWQKLDNNPKTIALAADASGNLYQLHNDGAIWKYTGTPMTGWQELDNNPQATAIVADGNGDLFQLHKDGAIWKYTGPPMTGWQELDNNSQAVAIFEVY